jgi:peptidyl-prolyl cis-trans isomerase D
MAGKEKNKQEIEAKPKKESTSILEKIRRRTGLLVGLVGLALVIFILESLLGSGASIFGNDEYTSVGYINGNKVDRNDFMQKYEAQLNNYRQRSKGEEVDESMKGQAIESIWQQYVVQYAVKPAFEKMGIVVGEDELYQKVVINPQQSIIEALTDPNTGKLSEQFARPDGSMDIVKWKQAVQSVVGEQEMAVKQMEDNVKTTLYFQKFRALIKKGLYATTVEGKIKQTEEAGEYDIDFVHKPFSAISDTSAAVTESDLKKYYNDHSWEFMNKETSRRLEYVIFNVNASPEDVVEIEKEANRVAQELKGKSPGEDSLIQAQESENGNIVVKNHTRKTMTVRDSGIFTAQPGTVYGPYNEGAYYKIYKLQEVSQVADSARVRHILVATNDPKTSQPKRSKELAKREADSILTVIKTGKNTFDSLVRHYSDDLGSVDKGGDYGWFDQDKSFVEPFKNAGLKGTKGNISVVETQFGYHIIEVLDVSKTKHTSYRVAEVLKPIVASEETNQRIFAHASQFAGENNTAELFDKAADREKLTKRMADNIRETDRQLPGLPAAREMVKWSYTAKKGEVGLFSMPDKHVVAKLAGIRTEGLLPMEEVKDDLTLKALKQKKSEMLLAEFTSKAGNCKTVDEAGQKLGITPTKQERMHPETSTMELIGRDYIMGGTATGLKKGQVSRPSVGEQGVFILALRDFRQGAQTIPVKDSQKHIEETISARSDYQSFNALKALADIKDYKYRID